MKLAALFFLVLGLFVSAWGKDTVLHSFDTGAPTNGRKPLSSLTLSGSVLYGTTEDGGRNDKGTVFRVNTNGTGFKVLHDFEEGADGFHPNNPLVVSGDTIYGMCVEGGTSDIDPASGLPDGGGTIFSLKTDGTGWALLHGFPSNRTTDGYAPIGLLLVDQTLYGMAALFGPKGKGVLFSIATNGDGYQILHSFSGVTDDGGNPRGSLALQGATLFGLTHQGGTNGTGVIFSIDLSGTNFKVMHSFGDTGDGYNPESTAPLVVTNDFLYGTTYAGGEHARGTVFRISPSGDNYKVLRSFSANGLGPATDGGALFGGVSLYGTTLYGTALNGGDSRSGIVYSLQTDGSGFSVLHGFAGGTDGAYPYFGQPTISEDGTTLYGTTAGGGGNNLRGVIYSVKTGATQFLPQAVTLGSASVTDTRAKLSGKVNPRGLATKAWFVYGTDATYGSSTPMQGVGQGKALLAFSGSLAGLQPHHTTYHTPSPRRIPLA